MNEWGESPPTFDRSSDAWGAQGAFAEEGEGGGEQYLELIGSQLWVAGMVDLGRFRRVSDFVNLVQGYMVLKDVVVLSRMGEASRLTMPELRVLPDDIAVVGQLGDDKPQARRSESAVFIEKTAQRLVLLTRHHIIDGDVFIHGDGSIMAFVDATDPKFIPMSDVRVRWISDRKLAARYPFALVQRTQILGVATEGIKLGGAESTLRRAAMLKAQVKAATESDGLGDEIGSTARGRRVDRRGRGRRRSRGRHRGDLARTRAPAATRAGAVVASRARAGAVVVASRARVAPAATTRAGVAARTGAVVVVRRCCRVPSCRRRCRRSRRASPRAMASDRGRAADSRGGVGAKLGWGAWVGAGVGAGSVGCGDSVGPGPSSPRAPAAPIVAAPVSEAAAIATAST